MEKRIRAAALCPRLALANPMENARLQEEAAKAAAARGCNLIVFPKDSLTGANCGNLFYSHRLKKKTEEALNTLAKNLKDLEAVVVTGFGTENEEKTAFLYKGEIFYSYNKKLPFDIALKSDNFQRASVIVYPDAKAFCAGEKRKLILDLKELSLKSNASIIYANASPGESTGNAVYSGLCAIAKKGRILAASEVLQRKGSWAFANLSEEAEISYDPKHYEFSAQDPFVPIEDANSYCSDILLAQAIALSERLERAHSKKAIIGISGGSDSTLAVLAATKAMEVLKRPSSDVIAVTMPGFGTSARTKNNAYAMMKALNCDIREIPIAKSVMQHFEDIGQDPKKLDVTYENSQARERTQILMDLSNLENGMVIGTGDISEAALGWCTYNGDHMAMYSLNSGLTKGLVKKTIEVTANRLLKGERVFSEDKDAKKLAECLLDVLDTPVSPELLPADEDGKISQITEDKVGPYALHDFFLYYFVKEGLDPDEILEKAEDAFIGRYKKEVIEKWLKVFIRRFFTQQFKRNCSPEGPSLVGISLSPRGSWTMPSDADYSIWL